MSNKLLWWGYKHTNGSYQVKRYWDNRDIDEARQSPFCAKVSAPFFAENRDEALYEIKQILN